MSPADTRIEVIVDLGDRLAEYRNRAFRDLGEENPPGLACPAPTDHAPAH